MMTNSIGLTQRYRLWEFMEDNICYASPNQQQKNDAYEYEVNVEK